MNDRLNIARSGLLCLFLPGLLLCSCAPEEIRQYRVARVSETQPAVAQQQTAPFSWTLPTGWKVEPVSGMRVASFSTPGKGDVSVVNLPGSGGDLKGNLNRWRGQVGLPPIEDEQAIQKSFGVLDLKDRKAMMLELFAPSGQPDRAMRVALLEKDGVVWFFKLAGTQAVVKTQQQAFESFLTSLRFTAVALPPAMAGNQNMAPGSAMPPLPATPTDTALSYTLPAHWREKPAGNMRVAAFEIQLPEGLSGEVSIVNLAGDGGGLLNNVNRWRRQLEMAPTDQAGLKNLVRERET